MKPCKVLIVGVGLIGGSLALALRQKNAVTEIVGAGRTTASLDRAVQLGVIDRYTTNLVAEIKDSKVVVVATPVMAVDAVFQQIAQADLGSTVITDVGSVKGSIVTSAKKHLGGFFHRFVGGHPIAGRENSGVDAATHDLFENKRTILTPTSETDPDATRLIRSMWQLTGSRVSNLDVIEHDNLLSASSHLPHMIAFGLVHYIVNHPRSQACFDLAASGFYDFTRIASSAPTMWRDICLANSTAISKELEGYIAELMTMMQKISGQDSESISHMFSTSKYARDKHLAKWLG